MLFKRFKPIKEYYTLQLKPSNTAILKKYKKRINDQFFPSRGFGNLKYSVIKRAISDFKKVSDSEEDIITLLLYFVESGIGFIQAYGGIAENFYEHIEDAFEKAAKMVNKMDIEESYKKAYFEEFKILVDKADGIGYGLHDGLLFSLMENFPEFTKTHY
jgi:hypothetical protein